MWGILAIVVLATAIVLAFAMGAFRPWRQIARWERVLSENRESRGSSPAAATRSDPITLRQTKRLAPRSTNLPETAPTRPPSDRRRKIEARPEVTAGAPELATGVHAIELRQRLVGGGEVVRGCVHNEGGRGVWKFEAIDADLAYALQREVVIRSGVWPGAGEAYLAAVLAVFPCDDPASRWYAVQQHQQVA